MKPNLSLLVLLAVVLLAGLYFGSRCNRPPDEHEVAMDSLRQELQAAKKAVVIRDAAVRATRALASRSARDADTLRSQAQRLRRVAQRLADSLQTHTGLNRSGAREVGRRDTTTPRESDESLVASLDSLVQAYDLMVRVDSLNQVTIGALTRRIAADSEYIGSLERLRDAARTVVETKPGRKLFGCTIGPTALTDLSGALHAGAGMTCGLRL